METPDIASLGTSRTINSLLWFVNNPILTDNMLGYLAKYQDKHQVKLYAFNIQGNHYHLNAQFPNSNRSAFYRDFNARTAEAVRIDVHQFPGGPVFARRFSAQVLLLPEDVEDYFFYCALQPVQAGLCARLSDYPGYNSFHDAIHDIRRKRKVVNWAKYKAHKRYNPNVSIAEFTVEYELRYSRLPGYEHLSQKEYARQMLEKLEKRRIALVTKMKQEGHRFLTKEELRKILPGTAPHNTKKGTRRPIVLSVSPEAKQKFLEWYFGIVASYRLASKKYLAGDPLVEFPPYTYKPPGPYVPP